MPHDPSGTSHGLNAASGEAVRLMCYPAGGDPVQTVREALLATAAMAVESGRSRVGVAVPAAGNLMGTIEQVLGTKQATRLARQGAVQIGILELMLVTQRRPFTCAVPVLACFTQVRHTLALARSRITALVYVPWAEEERTAFLAACPDAEPVSMG